MLKDPKSIKIFLRIKLTTVENPKHKIDDVIHNTMKQILENKEIITVNPLLSAHHLFSAPSNKRPLEKDKIQ